MITLIAAIGRNREIGFRNKLLCNIPEDMKHFKDYTMGKTIIMGKNPFVSIGRLLPGRRNIVISSTDLADFADLVIHAKTIKEALSIEDCYLELVIIGGASIYQQTIDFADKLVITHIDAEFTADAFFPEIDMAVWKINSIVAGGINPHNYKFIEYIRNESI